MPNMMEEDMAVKIYVNGVEIMSRTEYYAYMRENYQDILAYIGKIVRGSGEHDEYDYADNYRIAAVNNEFEVMMYERIKEDGCCGSYDRKINFKGKEYFIGFNYGH